MQRQAVLMISENIPSMTPCTLKEPFVTAAEKKLLMLDSVIPASQKSFLPVYRGWGTEGACIDLVSNTKYKKIHLTAGLGNFNFLLQKLCAVCRN